MKKLYHEPCPSKSGLINDKEIASIMTGEINQGNVHLLLPSKVCWLAPWLAEDEGISLIETVKRVYSSAMYKQLEIESTKMWHLGPIDLYRELRGNPGLVNASPASPASPKNFT